MPHFAVPDGETPATYLEHLCREGAQRKYGHIEGEVAERLAFELKVITDMGFPTYFLVVWDFIRYAKEQGILVGPGRGSAAGSIVAYCLDITTVDPLAHGLLFERFLNPSRISMPDIDIDFADDRRDVIIKYVTEKYGAEQVSQIITFGTLAARAAIRDVGPRARHAVWRCGSGRETDPAGARAPRLDRAGARAGAGPQGAARPRREHQAAARYRAEVGGCLAARFDARGGHRHLARSAHPACAVAARRHRRQCGRDDAVPDGLAGGTRPPEDGLPRPEDAHGAHESAQPAQTARHHRRSGRARSGRPGGVRAPDARRDDGRLPARPADRAAHLRARQAAQLRRTRRRRRAGPARPDGARAPLRRPQGGARGSHLRASRTSNPSCARRTASRSSRSR